MDIAWLVRKLPFTPPLFSEESLAKFGRKIEHPRTVFPKPSFAAGIKVQANGSRLPQAIAHRGSTLEYPENTIKAFEAAINLKAHALETDVHLTKDGVVVLSHDADLKRCFGQDVKIKDRTWAELSSIRTLKTPHEPLPRLDDLLKLLSKPECQHIWLLLDIKTDDDPTVMMRTLAKVFSQVTSGASTSWSQRIILGYWMAQYIPLCAEFFPGFSITNIGFSPEYSRNFLEVDESAFVMLQAAFLFNYGRKFQSQIQSKNRQLYAWTVNDEKSMAWCIEQNFDGVVTDDVPKFLQICASRRASAEYKWSTKLLLGYTYFNVWLVIFGLIFRSRYKTSFLSASGEPKKRQ